MCNFTNLPLLFQFLFRFIYLCFFTIIYSIHVLAFLSSKMKRVFLHFFLLLLSSTLTFTFFFFFLWCFTPIILLSTFFLDFCFHLLFTFFCLHLFHSTFLQMISQIILYVFSHLDLTIFSILNLPQLIFGEIICHACVN